MENITSTAELLDAIQLMEAEQDVKLILMKQNFRQASESLNPANIIEKTFKGILASPYLGNNIVTAGVGIAAGFASKKAVIGRSNSKFKRFLGIILQLGVTNLIAKHPETVKSIGQFVSQHIFQKEK